MSKNSKETAFPIFLQNGLSEDCHVEIGLTKREYFAGLAMQGFLAFPGAIGGRLYPTKEKIIETSIAYADELVKQLGQ